MYLSGRHLELRRSGRQSNPRRVILFLILILIGVTVWGLRVQEVIPPLGVPTAMPTRMAVSYAEEGEALFSAGNLKDAIVAYTRATQLDSQNVDYWVALARTQIYARKYEDALGTAEKARVVAPNSVKAWAVFAWTLDWNVEGGVTGCRCKTYADAERAAQQALALDRNYAPAHAYYSEILNDSGKWDRGINEAEQALALEPNSLDARRAMGVANEAVGNYEGAIERYKTALALNPNLITLYLRLGRNYQQLAQRGQTEFYQEAINAYLKAISIDAEDIDPYLALSQTYYQSDELGSAKQYLLEALQLQPLDPKIHGQLGLLYLRSKNYEGAEPELKCATVGGECELPDGTKVKVPGLPLAEDSKEYYYTYGNLLAYQYKCKPNEAPAILNMVYSLFPDDKTVVGSYQESMAICSNYLAGTPDPNATPTATPKP